MRKIAEGMYHEGLRSFGLPKFLYKHHETDMDGDAIDIDDVIKNKSIAVALVEQIVKLVVFIGIAYFGFSFALSHIISTASDFNSSTSGSEARGLFFFTFYVAPTMTVLTILAYYDSMNGIDGRCYGDSSMIPALTFIKWGFTIFVVSVISKLFYYDIPMRVLKNLYVFGYNFIGAILFFGLLYYILVGRR